MRVFLGITGASGAPYAARLLEAFATADCEVGVCASDAGVEVLATELYGQARLSRDETIARLLQHAGGGSVTASRTGSINRASVSSADSRASP